MDLILSEDSKLFLTQLSACICGSMHNGYLVDLRVRIPFSVDWVSALSPSDSQFVFSTSDARKLVTLNSLSYGIAVLLIELIQFSYIISLLNVDSNGPRYVKNALDRRESPTNFSYIILNWSFSLFQDIFSSPKPLTNFSAISRFFFLIANDSSNSCNLVFFSLSSVSMRFISSNSLWSLSSSSLFCNLASVNSLVARSKVTACSSYRFLDSNQSRIIVTHCYNTNVSNDTLSFTAGPSWDTSVSC